MRSQKVNIGVTEYDLYVNPQERIAEKLPEEMAESLAFIDSMTCEIHISSNIPTQLMKQCFFHEVTHGMLDEIGMQELNADEGFVDALSKQIYALFIKNDVAKIISKIADCHECKRNSIKSTT